MIYELTIIHNEQPFSSHAFEELKAEVMECEI